MMNVESSFDELLLRTEELKVDEKLTIKSKYRQEPGVFRINVSVDSQHYTCAVKRASDLKQLGKLNSIIFLALVGAGKES